MNLDEARKVLWLKNNHRPMGELLDKGLLTSSNLEWAAERAYDPTLKQAAKVILESQKQSVLMVKKKDEPTQPPLGLQVGLPLEKACAMSWPFSPYKGQPMGKLVESKQLSLKDLGYAIENAFDEKVRQASIALTLVRLDQVVKEPARSAGFVHVISGGRSYSQRKQYQLTLLLGLVFGIFITGTLIATMLFFKDTFQPHPQAKPLSDVLSNPLGIVSLILALAFVLFIAWLVNFVFDRLTKWLDKKIDEHRLGEVGEEKAVQMIVQALDGNWRVFRNILIPGRNKGDLDLVLVGPPGVWSLEVKNWGGEYRNTGENWEYRHGKKWKTASGNPSRQAVTNASRLGNFFKADGLKVFVNAAVVWANEENQICVKNPSVAVWPINRLVDELGNIWQGEKLSQAEREKINAKLTKLCEQSKEK